jgi:Ca2+/Na+ antiporter
MTIFAAKFTNDMKKQYIIFGVVIALLIAALGYVAYMLQAQKSANAELQELAELDKQEMEDQYRQFDIQYGELQKQLKNDSLIAQIEEERRHTQELLEELQRTKATDAAEITRLKKEISSLRKVLQSYIMQVDSLNRLNETLVAENTEMKEKVVEQNTQISNLRTEASTLKDKVDIAAQLDATGFWVTPKNKRSKDEKKAKNVKKLAFGFTIVKNVTAKNGERVIYARILKPDNSVLGNKGTFDYENTSLEYTEKKYIDYNGEEQAITMYSDVEEFIGEGTYKVFIFCDKQMIGQTSFTLK